MSATDGLARSFLKAMAVTAVVGISTTAFAHEVGWTTATCPLPFDTCMAGMNGVVGDFERGGFTFTRDYSESGRLVELEDVNGTDTHMLFGCDPDTNAYHLMLWDENTGSATRNNFKEAFKSLMRLRYGEIC